MTEQAEQSWAVVLKRNFPLTLALATPADKAEWEKDIAKHIRGNFDPVEAVDAIAHGTRVEQNSHQLRPTPYMVAQWIKDVRAAHSKGAERGRIIAQMTARLKRATPADRWELICGVWDRARRAVPNAQQRLGILNHLEDAARAMPGGLVVPDTKALRKAIGDFADGLKENVECGLGYRWVRKGERVLPTDEVRVGDGWRLVAPCAVGNRMEYSQVAMRRKREGSAECAPAGQQEQ
jgi:hypothetical protein